MSMKEGKNDKRKEGEIVLNLKNKNKVNLENL